MFIHIRKLSVFFISVLLFSMVLPVYAVEKDFTISSLNETSILDNLEIPENIRPIDELIVPEKVLIKYKEGTTQLRATSIKSSISAITEKTNTHSSAQTLALPKNTNVMDVVKKLRANPDVEYAEPVYKYSISENSSALTVSQSVYTPNDTYYIDEQWGLQASQLESAWSKVSSSQLGNITIAILDTGVKLDHEDLAGSIVAGYDFINKDTIPDDDHGHGTHVAGIAAAISNNSTGIAGVAGGAKIMPVKVLDSTGSSEGTEIIDGIRWAADNGADIINLSLGRPQFAYDLGGDLVYTYSSEEYNAIQYAVEKGVIVIAAAGNESNHYLFGEEGDLDSDSDDGEKYFDWISFPAAYENAISVGALDWSDTFNDYILADFSNIGPEIDVVAPGVGIYSTTFDGGYDFNTGTSMAAPFVSGVAALLLASDNSLTDPYPSGMNSWTVNYDYRVQSILEETSMDLGDVGKDIFFGAGAVQGTNLLKKIKLNMEWNINGSNENEVIIDLKLLDYAGTVSTDVYSTTANLETLYYHEGLMEWIILDERSIDLISGEGTATLNILGPGTYIFEATGTAQEWTSSTVVATSTLPDTDRPTWNSGQLTASQITTNRVDLSWNGYWDNLDVTQYTIYQDDELIATVIGNTYEVTGLTAGTIYNFKVEAGDAAGNWSDNGPTRTVTTTTPSNGGGGGGFYFPPTDEETLVEKIPTKTDMGLLSVIVKANKEKFLEKLNTGEDVTIDSTYEEKADKLIVEFSSAIVNAAKDENKKITIKSNQATFIIDPGTLDIADDETVVKFTVKESEAANQPSEASLTSSVIDLYLEVGESQVSRFNKAISITLNLNASDVNDKDKLGVYYYNENRNAWDYIGGKVNNNTIQFATDHFSQYAAMEYNKTFTDIQGHWAKNDIEIMAAKHIAKGVSADEFAPNANITRAEFTALLVRALDLQQTSDKQFADVTENKWYYDAVNKAYTAGIINDEDTFAPNAQITREQMALMLMQAYSIKTGIKLGDINTTQEVKFTDEGSASQWARTYVRLVETTGLMSGNPDGSFGPKANAKRAEAISVIKRLLDK